MGGRDHSCDVCGHGGFNDPDGVCVCRDMDRHLEAAAEALWQRVAVDDPSWDELYETEQEPWRHDARLMLTAYFSSLLGELPGRAVDAAIDTAGYFANADVTMEEAITAFLQSLRDSLASGKPDV